MEFKNVHTPSKFDGQNFSIWKFRMENYLDQYGLKEYIINNPQERERSESYINKDKECKNILVNLISDPYIHLIRDKTTSFDIWNTLVNHFERKSVAKHLTSRLDLLKLKLNPNESLNNHFFKFDKKIKEVNDSGINLEDTEIIFHLLATLPSYHEIIKELDAEDASRLTIDFVKRKLLDHEVKIRISKSPKLNHSTIAPNQINAYTSSQINDAFTSSIQQNLSVKTRKCGICRFEGHTRMNCPKIKKPRFCAPLQRSSF